jgi:hypothetical protein
MVFELSWPRDEHVDIEAAIRQQPHCAYGDGRHDGEMYVISKREFGPGSRSEVQTPFLKVRGHYSDSLDQLCYTILYHRNTWNAVEELRREPLAGSNYEEISRITAATLKYHMDALERVVTEVRAHRKSPIKIRALDEWLIRRKFLLESASMEKLTEAEKNGLFSKDLRHDPEHFSKLFLFFSHSKADVSLFAVLGRN